MSKLTECQITAMISRLESALELYSALGKPAHSRVVSTSRLLAGYRQDLARIQAMPAEEQARRAALCTSPKGRR
jgi:hypothetical protein